MSGDEVTLVIKQTSINKACGEDEIFPEFLKHCGPRVRDWLAKLYSDIIESGTIPPVLKKAKIVAILKPGKPDDQPDSYRPIALLSVIYKLLERIIYNRISGDMTRQYLKSKQVSGHTVAAQIRSWHLLHTSKTDFITT